MKTGLFFLLTCCASLLMAQNTSLKNVESLVNTKCIGSPSDRGTQKQAVKFRMLDRDSVELATETHELSSGSVLRRNKFHFSIADIDADNITVKQFGSMYGVFLYTKDRKKNISQAVFLAGDPDASVYHQDMLCICDFENIQTAEAVKAELIKAIALIDRQPRQG